jgi:(p)ppGpp synthase/HD superfamily hydrolase
VNSVLYYLAMILTPRLTLALDTAAILHKDHTRIGKEKTPYITHLIHVLSTVSNYTHDEDTLIAALLHDTVEDVEKYTLEKVENDFGLRVKEIVEKLTEVRVFDETLTPKERWVQAKTGYIDKLTNADGAVHLISAADKIHNIKSILDGYKNKDEILMLRFDGLALRGQVWFTGEVLKALSGNIPEVLEEEYRALHKELTLLSEKFQEK